MQNTKITQARQKFQKGDLKIFKYVQNLTFYIQLQMFNFQTLGIVLHSQLVT
jgi:hypothetical protein